MHILLIFYITLMICAADKSIGSRQERLHVLVLFTVGNRAEIAEESRWLSALVTVVPGALPPPKWGLFQAEAGEVVGLGAQLAIADHQFTSITAPEAVIF